MPYIVCLRCAKERPETSFRRTGRTNERAKECRTCESLKDKYKKVGFTELERLFQSLQAILVTDTKALMIASSKGKLCRDDAASLVNYIKLTGSLIQRSNEEVAELSDDELRKIVAKDKNLPLMGTELGES